MTTRLPGVTAALLLSGTLAMSGCASLTSPSPATPATSPGTVQEQRVAQEATNELLAAQVHLQRDEPAAALNRCHYLIEHYPDSPVIDDALALMAKAYRQLGLAPRADATLAILQGRQLANTTPETGTTRDQ